MENFDLILCFEVMLVIYSVIVIYIKGEFLCID